jgi:hypothetical protein
MVLGQIHVLIPTAMEELNEPHAALGHAPREQTVRRKRTGLLHVGTIQRQRGFALLREIGQLGHRRLHAVGHLILRHARGDLRVAKLALVLLVQLRQVIEEAAAALRREALGVR